MISNNSWLFTPYVLLSDRLCYPHEDWEIVRAYLVSAPKTSATFEVFNDSKHSTYGFWIIYRVEQSIWRCHLRLWDLKIDIIDR